VEMMLIISASSLPCDYASRKMSVTIKQKYPLIINF